MKASACELQTLSKHTYRVIMLGATGGGGGEQSSCVWTKSSQGQPPYGIEGGRFL